VELQSSEAHRRCEIGHSRRPAIKLSFRLQTQVFKPGKIVAEIPRLEPELRFGRTLKQGLKVAKFPGASPVAGRTLKP